MITGNSVMAYSQSLVHVSSYFGIFLIILIVSMIPLIPVPICFPLIVLASAFLNPWVLGITTGIASAIGEFTGYFAGLGTYYLFSSKKKETRITKCIKKIEELIQQKGFITVILMALIPLIPSHTLTISGGFLRYKKTKLFLGILIGRILRMLIYAFIGYYGIKLFV